jgi:hypothetical protein
MSQDFVLELEWNSLYSYEDGVVNAYARPKEMLILRKALGV